MITRTQIQSTGGPGLGCFYPEKSTLTHANPATARLLSWVTVVTQRALVADGYLADKVSCNWTSSFVNNACRHVLHEINKNSHSAAYTMAQITPLATGSRPVPPEEDLHISTWC